jgi:hypothetical protein
MMFEKSRNITEKAEQKGEDRYTPSVCPRSDPTRRESSFARSSHY